MGRSSVDLSAEPVRARRTSGRMVSVLVVTGLLVLAGCSAGGQPVDEAAGPEITPSPYPTDPETMPTGTVTSVQVDVDAEPGADAEPDADADAESDAESDGEVTPDRPETAAAGLVWTVVAVGFDDVLNVRAGPSPDQPVVAELSPWATSLPVRSGDGGPESRTEGAGTWIRVADEGIGDGWVNERFVVAQPVDLSESDRAAMVDASQGLLAVLTDDGGTAVEDLGPSFGEHGVWVGGIGVYADLATPWQWIPTDEVDEPGEWLVDRNFELPSEADFSCPECRRSLVEFVGLNNQDQPVEILIDDVADPVAGGFYDGALFHAPSTLHRVVLHQPNTEFVADDGSTQPNLDWRRIHLVFDWSGGQPRIALINVHGWTP